jgi:hypothetical protein
MRIAIFSDLHGKVLLPFKLVDLYQKETGKKIDFILQCGDIGVYPNIENLDKPTLKHVKYDRDELGFYDDFIKENVDTQTFLNSLNINMICVRGNHEDHDFLDNLENATNNSLYPIDIYKRIFICKSGHGQELKADNEVLSFVGIGRIGDSKGRTGKRFIQEYEKTEIKKLFNTREIYDLLITHDKDDRSLRGDGMAEIRELLDNVIFHYHFYGHTGEPFNQEIDYNGITQSIKIHELEFGENGALSEGCMIILEKINNKLSTEIVEQKLINKLKKDNWKI